MCDLYLTEDAKERITLLRANNKEEVLYEQSTICQAMSIVIDTIITSRKDVEKEMKKVLYVLHQYNMLVTELSKEN